MGCATSRDPIILKNKTTYSKKSSKEVEFEVYAAIKSHNLSQVKQLIETKFSIRHKMSGFMGRTALHIAAEYDALEIAKHLLIKGSHINEVDNCGCPAIFIASQYASLEVLKLLLEENAKVNTKNYYQLTIKDYIHKAKKVQIEKIFIENGLSHLKSRSVAK